MHAGLFAARSSTIATCERLLNVQFQVNIIIFHCIHELIQNEQDLLTYFFYYCGEISTFNVPYNPWQQLTSPPSSRLSVVPEGKI